MKILFISCWYPAKDDQTNGIYIREHARAIKASGKEIVVIALRISNGNSFFTRKIELFTDESELETHLIHVNSVFWKWLYSIPYFSHRFISNYFSKEIAPKFSPDIIHSNILYPCAIAGDKLARKLKKKHVITEHWSGVEKFMKKNIFRSRGKRAYHNASAISVVSKFLEHSVLPYCNDPKRVQIIPNVVDPSVFFFGDKRESNCVTLTAIATWNRFKMPHLFTEALFIISKDLGKKIILNFIGEGEYLEKIKMSNFTKEENFTINYLGILDRKKVAET